MIDHANMIVSETNPLWGGRFSEGASDLLIEINSTVHFDYRLAEADIAGSTAHIAMLEAQGLVSPADAHLIAKGLEVIRKELRDGTFILDPALEDVHMNIESRLHQLIGAPAGRLHTGRSRNDQVAVDSKLWCKAAIVQCDELLADIIDSICRRAESLEDAVMPGFTHLQSAQPVTLGHSRTGRCSSATATG